MSERSRGLVKPSRKPISNLRLKKHVSMETELLKRNADNDMKNEVCFVKQVQSKLAHLLACSASVTSQDDYNQLKRYLDLLKSRSEEMIVFIQVMLTLKKDLAHARLDFARTEKLGYEVRKFEERVVWLEQRLVKLSRSCDHFFRCTENELHDEGVRVSASMFSLDLREAMNPTTREAIFHREAPFGGITSTDEGVSLKALQQSIAQVISTGGDVSQDELTTEVIVLPNASDFDDGNDEVELTSHPHRDELNDDDLFPADHSEPTNQLNEENVEESVEELKKVKGELENLVDAYWQSEHHRHEWSNFYMEKISDKSWHRLGISFPDSFLKKQPHSSAQLPWQHDEPANDLIGYHKVALNRLLVRLHKMYEAVEHATLSSVEEKSQATLTDPPVTRAVKTVTYDTSARPSRNTQPIPATSSDILPAIERGPTQLSSALKSSLVTTLKDNDDDVDPMHQLMLIRRESEKCMKKPEKIFPRAPTLWCPQDDYEQVASTAMSQHKIAEPSDKISAMRKRSSIKQPKAIEGLFSDNKKQAMKRAAARVKAVAKIKLQLIPESKDHESKVLRVMDLLSSSGLKSENQRIAVDAAKGLSQLNCKEEVVFEGLKEMILKNKASVLAYECSKALIMLGKWHPDALTILNKYLHKGNKNLQLDVLAAIKKSQNSHFVNKASPEVSLLGSTLVEIIRSNESADLRFDAAVCLGHMCINDRYARDILIQKLNDPSYSVKASALYVLVKQMNYKERNVIDAILLQVSSANSWKHRMQALDLLIFIGVRGLKQYGMQKVFDTLESLLWNHPSKEFRSKVAQVLSDFSLKEDACYVTFKRLDDRDEMRRAGAVIALATLQMKGEKELKALIDILELDSSLYVRSQVIKSFRLMNWSDPRIVRALQERERGDSVLAMEAKKALKVLEKVL